MAEPITSSGAGLSIIAMAAALQAWGVDGVAIVWGCAGGLYLLSRKDTEVGVKRASLSIMASTGAAGGISPLVTHGVLSIWPAMPRVAAMAAIAFIIGVGAQKFVPWLIETIPSAGTRWLDRALGKGPKNEQ